MTFTELVLCKNASGTWEDTGKGVGRTAGMLVGAATGLALPALMGYSMGSDLAQGAQTVATGEPLHPSLLSAASGHAGAVVSLPMAVVTTPVGFGFGGSTGEQLGGFIGKRLDRLYTPEYQAAEKIRNLPLDKGYALLKTVERTGGSDTVVQSMREALRDRLKVGSVVRDPLRDDELGPDPATNYANAGKQIGRVTGMLGGVAALAAGPVILGTIGHHIGGEMGAANYDAGWSDENKAKYYDQYLHGSSTTIGLERATEQGQNLGQGAGYVVGGLLGANALVSGAPLRLLWPLVESRTDELAGHAVGGMLNSFVPRERKMVSKIHSLSPRQGYALIRNLEDAGTEKPEVIKAMKDAYNVRRIGVQEQLKTSVLGIPRYEGLHDPLQEDTAPLGIRNVRGSLGILGGVLGAGLGVTIPMFLAGYALGDVGRAGGNEVGMAATGLGSVGGLAAAPLTSVIGYSMGNSAGRAVGEAVESAQAPERHAVDTIKSMTPADAYNHITYLERTGKATPAVIQAMKDTYNYRRRGYKYQLAATA